MPFLLNPRLSRTYLCSISEASNGEQERKQITTPRRDAVDLIYTGIKMTETRRMTGLYWVFIVVAASFLLTSEAVREENDGESHFSSRSF